MSDVCKPLHLGTLAQLQGTKGVIATLWPVADQSTGQFMQTLYRLRQEQRLSKAKALRQTQLAFLRGDGKDEPPPHPETTASAPTPPAKQPATASTSTAPMPTPTTGRRLLSQYASQNYVL